MIQKFKTWQAKDRYPNLLLEKINPVSIRAFSLINRNSNGLGEKEGAINILGSIFMLEGLDYHYNNFIELEDSDQSRNQQHELIAYLNTIGRLYYFIKSDFTKSLITTPLNLTPKTKQLNIYRRKISAHRSIDYPQNESEEDKRIQAITFWGFNYFIEKDNKKYYIPNGKEPTSPDPCSGR